MALDISVLSNEEKVAIVCLYFARLSSDDLRYKGKCSPALKSLSNKYNIKFQTLKNNKDRLDAQFENGRKGWHQTPLKKQNKFLYNVYLKYKDIPLDDLQLSVEEIIAEAEKDGKPFYSIKTKNPAQVEAILNKSNNVEIDGLNILKNDLTVGQPVFIVFGGDKPAWETGLIGMGIISSAPYDEGYEGKNYKIRIDVKVLLNKPIKRENLIPYRDTYDIIGIGPITKWEPNQAISSIPEKKAVALMRAMLEICPGIENDISSIIDEQLMARVKGASVKLVPQEVDYGEEVPTDIEQSNNEDFGENEEWAEVYEPDIDSILDGFLLSVKPVLRLKNFINAQKHIIMTGPPGTGKTTLAERACEEAVRMNFIQGYTVTTAVAEWSTFDTIGGYMPDKTGNLVFKEGVFLKSIRENKWLIIDEINRAEVDKAFGHFFTVLSGKNVELQYNTETADGDKSISICHTDGKGSYYDSKSATYYIGRNWRIIGTMNTYDKNSLFMLSYAFMRRFAFLYIPAPNDNDFSELINSRLTGQEDTARILIEITKASPKKIGAAVILDLINYLETAGSECVVDGICSLIIPQYEGISLPQIKQVYKDFGVLLSVKDREELKNYLCEFFDITCLELAKVRFNDNEDESDNDY